MSAYRTTVPGDGDAGWRVRRRGIRGGNRAVAAGIASSIRRVGDKMFSVGLRRNQRGGEFSVRAGGYCSNYRATRIQNMYRTVGFRHAGNLIACRINHQISWRQRGRDVWRERGFR